jgi:Ribosome associated membrane protein RAMP4
VKKAKLDKEIPVASYNPYLIAFFLFVVLGSTLVMMLEKGLIG